jgi:hypothetical protein
MEVYFEGLLKKEASGTKTGLGDFVFMVRHMYESDIRKDPMAFEMGFHRFDGRVPGVHESRARLRRPRGDVGSEVKGRMSVAD